MLASRDLLLWTRTCNAASGKEATINQSACASAQHTSFDDNAPRRQCSTADDMQGCTTAGLLDCRAAQRQGCLTARLHNGRSAQLQGCTTAGLLDCRAAQRQGCLTAGLHNGRTAQLQGCTTAGLLDDNAAQRQAAQRQTLMLRLLPSTTSARARRMIEACCSELLSQHATVLASRQLPRTCSLILLLHVNHLLDLLLLVTT